MIPLHISNFLTSTLKKKFGGNAKVFNASSLAGGSINSAYKLETSYGCFFIKFNKLVEKDVFETEAKGLGLLKNKSDIYIPDVIAFNNDCLILEYIPEKTKKTNFWENFGIQLAVLHKNTSLNFGLNHNNFIGSIRQLNSNCSSWVDFFINNRLKYLLKIGCFPSVFYKKFDLVFKRFDSVFKNESPSLLHGDLWTGNYICLGGNSALIDPAVYYGCKEIDLGMSLLFGGFDKKFYQGYNSVTYLDNEWKKRCDFCNFYPLLVHSYLFGSSYFNQTESLLNQYI
ncbi:MAG: fructosamine kinase family protein [Bacteroidota bacterium]|nr:fructosamine kinase family protein [Bacteroidota bacterium]